MAASVNFHPGCIYAKISLRCHYFNFYLMALSDFTEHLPGSNKVRYPISGRNDFTVLLRSVVGRQNYIFKKYPLSTIYDVFL